MIDAPAHNTGGAPAELTGVTSTVILSYDIYCRPTVYTSTFVRWRL